MYDEYQNFFKGLKTMADYTLNNAELRSSQVFKNKINTKLGDRFRFYSYNEKRSNFHEIRLSNLIVLPKPESAPLLETKNNQIVSHEDPLPRSLSVESQQEKLTSLDLNDPFPQHDPNILSSLLQEDPETRSSEETVATPTPVNQDVLAGLLEDLNNCYSTNMLALVVAKYSQKLQEDAALKAFFFEQMEKWIQKSRSVENYFFRLLLSPTFTVQHENEIIKEKINYGHKLIKQLITSASNSNDFETNSPLLSSIERETKSIAKDIKNDIKQNDFLRAFHKSHDTLQNKVNNVSAFSAWWAGSKEDAVIRAMIADLKSTPMTIEQLILISGHQKFRDALSRELKRTTGLFMFKKTVNKHAELLSLSQLDSQKISVQNLKDLLDSNYDTRSNAIQAIKQNFGLSEPVSDQPGFDYETRNTITSEDSQDISTDITYNESLPGNGEITEEEQQTQTAITITTEDRNELNDLLGEAILQASNTVKSITTNKIIHSQASSFTTQLIDNSITVITKKLAEEKQKQNEADIQNEVSGLLASMTGAIVESNAIKEESIDLFSKPIPVSPGFGNSVSRPASPNNSNHPFDENILTPGSMETTSDVLTNVLSLHTQNTSLISSFIESAADSPETNLSLETETTNSQISSVGSSTQSVETRESMHTPSSCFSDENKENSPQSGQNVPNSKSSIRYGLEKQNRNQQDGVQRDLNEEFNRIGTEFKL